MIFFDPSEATTAQIESCLRDDFATIRQPCIRRLKGGRTSAVFSVTGPEMPAPLAIKISRAGQDTPLFENRPLDEWRALCELSPLGLAPMPVGRKLSQQDVHILTYHFVDGALGASTASALATLLHRLHSVEPPAWVRTCASEPAELLAQSRQFLRSDLPHWASELEPTGPWDTAPIVPRLVHRDPIAQNIVTGRIGQPILIDWQCPAVGDPLEDIAQATSPAMACTYSGPRPFDVWDVLSSYKDNAVEARARQLLPLYRWRMLCYCHWHASRGSQVHAIAMEHEADALERLYSQRNQQG